MRWKIVIFLAYLCLTAIFCYFHEPWRDEVDPWLMARDSSVISIIKMSPNMGTPVLWHLILKPLVINGFPFVALTVLNWIFVVIGTAILVFQSPFSIPVLVAICSSWVISFEYPAIGRNYGLGLLGLFLLLGSWGQKKTSLWKKIQFVIAWPLLCFSSVHFLSWVPGLLLMDWLLEKEKPSMTKAKTIYLVPLALFVLSVVILWPSGTGQFSSSFVSAFQIKNLPGAVTQGFFPFFYVNKLSAGCSCILFLICLKECNYKKENRWITYILFVSVNSIFVFKYFHYAHRHSGFNWLLLIVSAWVGLLSVAGKTEQLVKRLTNRITWIFTSLALVNAFGSISQWVKEVNLPFTDAFKTAKFLRESQLLEKPISCFSEPHCSAILGYLPMKKQFWYPATQRWGTHMLWDNDYFRGLSFNDESAFERAYQFFEGQGLQDEFVYISNRQIESPARYGFRLVFADEVQGWRVKDEAFYVYQASQEATQN